MAFRVEGDKISIEEKINNLKKELELNNSDISILDVYQSEPFWKKINNLEQIYDLFNKLSSSSSEISGAVFIPDQSNDKEFSGKRNTVFKFNDLKSNVSFVAFRVEGDKISIAEKINNLKKELKLNNSDISTLDVYQSEPFWEKINNLEVFEKTEHNLIRMVIPPGNGSKLCKYL